MKKSFIILLLTFNAVLIRGQESTYPDWFSKKFQQLGLDSKYLLESFIKPAYLTEDFNGDKKQDCAALIIEKKTKKKGIILIHNSTDEFFVFGAGKSFGSGSDNFDWLKMWTIYTKPTAYETQFDEETGDILDAKIVKLKRYAIDVEDMEIAGGIIYWDDNKYIWIHQGE